MPGRRIWSSLSAIWTRQIWCVASLPKPWGPSITIARVRNPDYRRDAALLKREIGMDMVINPDLAAAREIARILSFPSASSVEPFAGGRIDMIGIQVTERDRFYGVALSESSIVSARRRC